MDSIITFSSSGITRDEVQTMIASKVEISDVQRIVNTSITDNTWPKTRSEVYYAKNDNTYTAHDVPNGTGSIKLLHFRSRTKYSDNKYSEWHGESSPNVVLSSASVTYQSITLRFYNGKLQIKCNIMGSRSLGEQAELTMEFTA